MFHDYQDIFNQRGLNYHQAMLKYPSARKEEFQKIIHLLDLRDGHLLLDIPSGGCYLSNFIDKNIKIFSAETSQQFIDFAQNQINNRILLCKNFNNIPLKSNYIDRVVSLAGIHHIENKLSFYQEIHRILKKDGIFCIGDVFLNSQVAKFLNIFVDQHNSLGHKGYFLTEKTREELKMLNFEVVNHARIKYYWYFDSVSNLIDYCQLLFGLDQANYQEIEQGIKEYLGYVIKDNQCYLNWELYFIKAIKLD